MNNTRLTLTVLVFAMAVLFLGAFGQRQAMACTSCAAEVEVQLNIDWEKTKRAIKMHVDDEFTAHKNWYANVLWEDNLLPALMQMADELSTVSLFQTQIIGSFFDAKLQMETQQAIQRAQVQAHKDYQPSEGMCEIGTGVMSLALSEHQSEYATAVLAERAQDRELGNAYTLGRSGILSDITSRIQQFRAVYCDPADNNGGLALMCGDGGPQERRNADIDYVRTFDMPWTLDVDFTDSGVSEGEEDIMALGANLYAHKLFSRITPEALADSGRMKATPLQLLYMDARSLVAKRGVAQNSFNAIAGLKAQGAPGSRDYLLNVLKRLGIGDEEAAAMLASHEEGNPSYYAQMEMLTKKMVQNPDFFTNLYDKPANVDRKGAALEAIGLMQKFDLFKSYLRQEAIVAVMLETELKTLEDEVEDDINQVDGDGLPAQIP